MARGVAAYHPMLHDTPHVLSAVCVESGAHRIPAPADVIGRDPFQVCNQRASLTIKQRVRRDFRRQPQTWHAGMTPGGYPELSRPGDLAPALQAVWLGATPCSYRNLPRSGG